MKKLTVFFMAAVLMVAITQTAEAQQFKWKLQSTQPAGTPHIELLNKLSNNIEKMSAGRLKIEVLPAGAIVDAFHILDGVDKGVVEMGQWWAHYAIGKSPAAGLFTSPLGGAASGLDQFNHVAWYLRGGGRDLYVELYQKTLRADVMPFFFAPDGPECLGWFKKPVTSVEDYKKLRMRMSSGLPSDALKAMGGIPVSVAAQEIIPSAERGVLDAVEWSNPATDIKLGPLRRLQVLLAAGPAPGDRHLGHRHQWQGVAVAAARYSGGHRSRDDGLHVGQYGLFPERKRQGPGNVGQGKGRYAVRRAAGLCAGLHCGFQEGASDSTRVKDPFFKKVLDSQRAYAKQVVPYSQEASQTLAAHRRGRRPEVAVSTWAPARAAVSVHEPAGCRRANRRPAGFTRRRA